MKAPDSLTQAPIFLPIITNDNRFYIVNQPLSIQHTNESISDTSAGNENEEESEHETVKISKEQENNRSTKRKRKTSQVRYEECSRVKKRKEYTNSQLLEILIRVMTLLLN